jgi:beta-N-acetylhexosaminidase
MIKKVLALCIGLIGVYSLAAQTPQSWADSVLTTLSLEEKIGQLFMPEWNGSRMDAENLIRISKNFNVGGIAITGGSAKTVAETLATVRTSARVPVFTSLSADWGAGKTLDSAAIFTLPLLVSATHNDSLIYQYAALLAHQLTSLGINFNMVSLVVPPPNISTDSLNFYWGNSESLINKRLSVYRKGLAENGVLMGVQQVPLSLLQSPKEKDAATQAAVYQHLFRTGIAGILPISFNVPTSLKTKAQFDRLRVPKAIANVLTYTQLEKQFQYSGLLFVRVPDLKTTSGKVRAGEPELFAFQTGNDVLVAPQNMLMAVRKIKKAVRREKNYQQQLDNSVRKILLAKQEAGLYKHNASSFNTTHLALLKNKVLQSAATVVANAKNVLPLRLLENKTFASVAIGASSDNSFNRYLSHYAAVEEYTVALPQDSSVFQSLSSYQTVIAGIFPFSLSWQENVVKHLKKLASQTNVIIVYFGSPTTLSAFADFETVIEAYTATPEMVHSVAQQIFGALPVTGTLPVDSKSFSALHGISVNSLGRLSEGLPEEVGMNSEVLERIKSIAYQAIDTGATPGCRVLVARKGKIVYDRAFGWLTYENKTPVTEQTIYDLASITKVSATLQATAFMHEKGLLDINKKMSVYLPELKGTNKEDFIIKDILTHQAGLWPFLPFWADTMKDSLHLPQFYANQPSQHFPHAVAHNLFAATAMKDSLWQWIIKSKVREKPPRTPYDYRYSDMGFYMLQHLAEKMLNQPMEDFVDQHFYNPLGAYTLGYLPLLRFPSNRIAPTENDRLFRKTLLTGYVHDQGAAMHGGVAGHAGLFGTAYDLAKLGQLWLNHGTYAGMKYFDSETVNYFSVKQYQNSRRGLGWDKSDFVNEAVSPTSKYASANTFGHTGFTGTCIWIDPDYELVYVFLSNRVHPDMTNNKLLTLNIRTRIHDVVYESIFEYEK